MYTQYPIMTKQKQVFRNVCKCTKKQTEISHLHKYSDPLLSTLLKHLWQRIQPRVFLGFDATRLDNCIWEVSPILLCKSSQALSPGWATQGHSETCPEATSALSWLCLGWGPECSGSRISLYFATFNFLWILTNLQVPITLPILEMFSNWLNPQKQNYLTVFT
jgi:hypothetical protein